jgi:hypothetical protein
VIIKKRNEPNLAKGHSGKGSRNFVESYFVLALSSFLELIVLKYGEFSLFFLKNMATFALTFFPITFFLQGFFLSFFLSFF